MSALTDCLLEQLTPSRRARFEEVLRSRTYKLTVVLEDIYQGHNAAAVLRSCECFGVQRVHCIEQHNKFKPSDEISMGASKWLDLQRWTNTPDCLQHLKDTGHQIVALTLRQPSIPLAQVPLDRPTALVYGTEEHGLSQAAHEYADIHAFLPMYGFTQSYNISVSAALSLQTLIPHLHSTPHWQLTEEETQALRLEWLKRSIPHWEAIAQRLGAL